MADSVEAAWAAELAAMSLAELRAEQRELERRLKRLTEPAARRAWGFVLTDVLREISGRAGA